MEWIGFGKSIHALGSIQHFLVTELIHESPHLDRFPSYSRDPKSSMRETYVWTDTVSTTAVDVARTFPPLRACAHFFTIVLQV